MADTKQTPPKAKGEPITAERPDETIEGGAFIAADGKTVVDCEGCERKDCAVEDGEHGKRIVRVSKASKGDDTDGKDKA